MDHPEELNRLRELLGRLDGVLGVWDRVRVAGRSLVTLDLGCGGATVLADLTPLSRDDRPPSPQQMARFFD